MLQAWPVFKYLVISNTSTILQQIHMKDEPSRIWRWDLNSRPLGHESPPITTGPVDEISFLYQSSYDGCK